MSRAKCVVTLVVACLVGPLFAAVTETIVDRVVTLSGSGTWTKSYSSAEVDSVVLGANANVTWTPTEPSTYVGGTVSLGSLLYLGANGALGSGDFDMRSGALSVASGADIVLDNKVIFNQNNTYGYACAMDGNGSLTLKSVGTPAVGATHHIRLGRAAATSAGTAVLSLTEPDSEALDQILLAGKAGVFLDGGTVKARSDAKVPFFSKVWANSEPEVTVRTGGVTFDVPEGTAVILGEELQFVHETRWVVAETWQTANWSFEENGSAGWTIDSSFEGGSGVNANGAPYDGNGLYPTTNGTHYVMIRRGGKLQQTISLPTAGKWRVVLERGCRDGNYSKNMGSWVKIGETKVMDMPRLSEPEGFTQYTSAAIDLEAEQEYLLSIEVEAVAAGNTSFNFDAIRLERVAEEAIPVPFGKSGAGCLYAGVTMMTGAVVAVQGGTLQSSAPALKDIPVAIADGATYALDGSCIGQDAAISVAAGGTLRFSGTMGNLLANGSFEAGATSAYTAGVPAGWSAGSGTFGIQTHGTTLSEGLDSGCGRQTLYLRGNSKVEQTVNIPADGTYRISFLEAPRQYLSPNDLPIAVKIDGEDVLTVAPRATRSTDYGRHTGTVTLTQGEHTFALTTGQAASGATAYDLLFDDVSLCADEKETVVEGTLSLVTGSRLVLDNAMPIRWMNVTLDGEPFVGNRAALSAAGVIVTGNGKFSAGGKTGLLLLFR